MIWKLYFITCLFAPTLLMAQCPQGYEPLQTNLIKNGDFEEGRVGYTTEHLYSSSRCRPGNYTIANNAKVAHSVNFTGQGQGDFLIIDGGKPLIAWSQEISVVPYTNYVLSFSMATVSLQEGPPAIVQLSINPPAFFQLVKAPKQAGQWTTYQYHWNSGNSSVASISFKGTKAAGGHDYALDKLRFFPCTAQPQEAPVAKNDLTNTIKESPKTSTQKSTFTETIEVTNKESATNQKVYEVFTEISQGKTVILEKIYFEQSKYDLLDASYPELEKLINTLNKNPGMKIAIIGHTDSVGHPLANWKLSLNRARAVANFLFKKGIPTPRVTIEGQGGNKPLAPNNTEEGRRKNRRVEFFVEKF